MKHHNMDLRDYYLFMKNLKDETGYYRMSSYDDIVANFCSHYLKIKL